MDEALRIIIFVGIVWLLATIYVNHPDLPQKITNWALDDYPTRMVFILVVGGILVVLVNMINYP